MMELEFERQPGERFGDYALAEALGRGGSGEAWRAENLFTGEEAAIKFCHDPALREALLNEAKTLGELRKASGEAGFPSTLARLLETQLSQEPPYLVMEYCPGRDLRGVLEKHGPLPPATVAAWMIQAARGLEWAHGRGILHRDIKPENLLLAAPYDSNAPAGALPSVKIGDFGLGRAVAARALSIHRSIQSIPGSNKGGLGILEGTSSGTLEYMSPEQLEGKPPAPATDIYSLGVVLFELLTGRRPRGNVLPSRLRPELDPAWDEAFDRCYQFEPKDRFESAAALADFIEERLGGGKPQGQEIPFEIPVGAKTFFADLARSVAQAFQESGAAVVEEEEWKPGRRRVGAAKENREKSSADLPEEGDNAFAALRRQTLANVGASRFLRFERSDSGEHAESFIIKDHEGARLGQWTHQESYDWPHRQLPGRARLVESFFSLGKRLAILGFMASIFFYKPLMMPLLWAFIFLVLADAILGDLLRGMEGKRSRAILHGFGNLQADAARVSAAPNNRYYLAVLNHDESPIGYVNMKRKRDLEVIDSAGVTLGHLRPRRSVHQFPELPGSLKARWAFYPTVGDSSRPAALFGNQGKEAVAVMLSNSLDASARVTLLNLMAALILKKSGSWTD
jgi:serine/threonine protein kinase